MRTIVANVRTKVDAGRADVAIATS
jgi:hypothetical protein